MKSALKLTFALTMYSVIACTALAVVNSFTAPVIAERRSNEIQKALNDIFPQANKFDDVISEVKSTEKTIKFDNAFLVKKDTELLGMAIIASGPTFNEATIMVGIDNSGKLKKISFIELTDTKGIGTKVLNDSFKNQFKGKAISDKFLVGKDVQGISGSTVSSKGVSKIVSVASKIANSYLEGVK
ncbi:MAG: hypothetical protein CR988_07185 [Treponema sp.]|nr:MAG: hypothetical protein CR988_07185 [Treponema sp.]